MLAQISELLAGAEKNNYALGAFNVYNLEGVRAVVAAAEEVNSPAILQIHPAALHHSGVPLVALCIAGAQAARVPIAVHLDHSTSADNIHMILRMGALSVMADGSHLSYEDNIAFTQEMALLAHEHHTVIEAELGRLSGTEDGLTIADYEAKLTDPAQAAEFAERTGVDLLAVCIGNVHGHYRSEPKLDFERLAAIRRKVSVPLVLHGASGLHGDMITRAIEHGVRKLNVNTELREAYIQALIVRLSTDKPDLLDLMKAVERAMQVIVVAKLRLFGSCEATSI